MLQNQSTTMCTLSPLGQWHDRQAPMSLAIDRPHCKNHVVFGELERGGRDISDILSVLPYRAACSPPNDFIAAGAARRRPLQSRIIIEAAGQNSYIGRRGRRRCGGGPRR